MISDCLYYMSMKYERINYMKSISEERGWSKIADDGKRFSLLSHLLIIFVHSRLFLITLKQIEKIVLVTMTFRLFLSQLVKYLYIHGRSKENRNEFHLLNRWINCIPFLDTPYVLCLAEYDRNENLLHAIRTSELDLSTG